MRRILAIIALLLVAIPTQAHTTGQLAAWYAAWERRVETNDWVLTATLVAEYADMRQRHPCFPEACQPEEVIHPVPTTTDTGNSEPVGPVVTPPPVSWTVEQWRPLVAAYFPADQINLALVIMSCESGGNPNAYNPSGASGLMQVLASWADNFGYLPAQLFDPAINLYVASILYYDGGWTHWNASKGCWG